MNKWNWSQCRSLPHGKVTVKTYLQHWFEAKRVTGRDELLWLWGNGSTDLRAVSQAGWGELQLWALVSSEKLIKSETAAGGKIGGRQAEGLKDSRSMKEKERREPLGVGLLEDKDYYCCHHCLIFPPPYRALFIYLPLFFPSLIFLSPIPPSLSFIIFLPPSPSFLALRVSAGCYPAGAVEEGEQASA